MSVPRFYRAHGLRLHLSAWSRRLGISKQALHVRIHLLHWPLERALASRRSHPACGRYRAGELSQVARRLMKCLNVREWRAFVPCSNETYTALRALCERGLISRRRVFHAHVHRLAYRLTRRGARALKLPPQRFFYGAKLGTEAQRLHTEAVK